MPSLHLAPVQPIPDNLEMPEAGRAQDGVFTRSQARAEGWGDRRQRRMLDSGLWVPIAGTVLRHNEVAEGPWQCARAVHLTGGLAASHATAGALWQLQVPAGLHGTGHVERRPASVTAHRIPTRGDERIAVRGLLVTSSGRTVTDLLCSLGERDGVTMLTDAFLRGLLTAADVQAAARRAHRRHGVTMARHLAHTCRHEPQSPLEWDFHGRVDALGHGWLYNVEIHDEEGFVGRVDALHLPTATVVELDSQRFHGPARFQSDRTRDQRLAALGFVVLRFTWVDMEHRPIDVIERIRRTVAIRERTFEGGRVPLSSSVRLREGRGERRLLDGGSATHV